MIAKIGKGANLYGVINYNFQKVACENGKILALNNIPESFNGVYSVSYFMKHFDPYLAANNKTEKPIRHISLNPDPNDQLNDEQLTAIAKEYMAKMEYEKQPFIIFKHTDIERTHLHIVTTCVRADGKKIPDYNDHRKSMDACRAIEKSFGLLPANEKNGNDQLYFRPVDYGKGNVKVQISSVIRYLPQFYKFQTLGAYNALLSLYNITVEEVRGEVMGQAKSGLVYFALDQSGHKTGNPLKASLFGKKSGLDSLKEHFAASEVAMKDGPLRTNLKNICECVMAVTMTEQEFSRQLLEHGINVVVRRSDQGRIYGMTFIDHESRCVWNGSQLGKGLSANAFDRHWNEQHNMHHGEKPIGHNQNDNVHHVFHFMDHAVLENLGENFIDGLSSLIPGGQGEDMEEIDFLRRMKKKKRRRRPR